jgi:predicted carbohydrate-binding protein with CBM5 and CBM33 domain
MNGRNLSVRRRVLALSPIVAAAALLGAQAAQAHGWVTFPPARVLLCYQGKNSNCNPGQPPSGFEVSNNGMGMTPAFPDKATNLKDGQIASTGRVMALDEQTDSRWVKTDLEAGRKYTFTWHPTASHRTNYVRYFITKNGWNPNKPLTRDQFEAKPFCEDINGFLPKDGAGFGKQLSANPSVQCEIPKDHHGYHVILSDWRVSDTTNSFINVSDVNIVNASDSGSATPASNWSDLGKSLSADEDLHRGDKLRTRVFISNRETDSASVSYTVNSDNDGRKEVWPYLFAKAINAAAREYRAGALDANDKVIANASGANQFYAKAGSNITDIELEIDKAPQHDDLVDSDLSVQHAGSVAINGTSAEIQGTFNVQKKALVTASLYQKLSQRLVGAQEPIEAYGNGSFRFTANNVTAGDYTLVIVAKAGDNAAQGLVQKSYDVKLTGGDVVAPKAVVTGPTQIEGGGILTLDGSKSEGAQIYHWIAPGNLRDLTGNNFQGSKLQVQMPETSQDQTYNFKLSVYAKGQTSSSTDFEVTKQVLLKAKKSDSGASASCFAAWKSATNYQGGNQVSRNGHNYQARWWVGANQAPGDAAYTGGEGSGKPWNDLGACK